MERNTEKSAFWKNKYFKIAVFVLLSLIIPFVTIPALVIWKVHKSQRFGRWIKYAIYAVVVFLSCLVVYALAGTSTTDEIKRSETSIKEGVAETQVPQITNSKAKTIPTEAQIVYSLTASAVTTGVSQIEVGGDTNLPDGSDITISGARLFTILGENDEREGRSGWGFAHSTVKDGKFKSIVELDDQTFLEFIQANGEKINLNYNINVTVKFNPTEGQTENIIIAVGNKGEKLSTSPNLNVIGALAGEPHNTLEYTFTHPLRFPLQDDLIVQN